MVSPCHPQFSLANWWHAQSFFSCRPCSQLHDFLSCMRELRQHLSRETPLPVLETKRHFLLFRGNSLRQLWSNQTSVCRQLLFFRRMCRLKLQQKPIYWKFPNVVWSTEIFLFSNFFTPSSVARCLSLSFDQKKADLPFWNKIFNSTVPENYKVSKYKFAPALALKWYPRDLIDQARLFDISAANQNQGGKWIFSLRISRLAGTAPEMIPTPTDPQVDPEMIPTPKWSPLFFLSTPKWSPRNKRMLGNMGLWIAQ